MRGALAGGAGFILPGLLMTLVIAAILLGDAPPEWILGVGAGAGAAVIAVILQAAAVLGRSTLSGRRDRRGLAYALVAAAAAALAGPYVVLALVGSGLLELAWRRRGWATVHAWPVVLAGDRGAPRGGVDGDQGRGALLRRGLRGHPAHAGRRRRPARLDDGDGVRERGRLRPAHARPGHAHGRARRLGGGRHGRGAARLRDRVRPLVPDDPASAASGSGACGTTAPRARSSTAPRPAAAGAIAGAAVPLLGGLDEAWQLAVLGVAGGLLLARPAPLLALAAGALAGLAVALAGGPLPG